MLISFSLSHCSLSQSYCAPLHAAGYEGETWPHLRYNLLRLFIFHFQVFPEIPFVARCVGKLVAAKRDFTMKAFVGGEWDSSSTASTVARTDFPTGVQFEETFDDANTTYSPARKAKQVQSPLPPLPPGPRQEMLQRCLADKNTHPPRTLLEAYA